VAYKITSREWHRKRKEQLVSYKGGKCFNCGGVFPACCYDFDHRVPLEKSFGVSEVSHSNKVTMEELQKEVDKCDLVCANCHRIRTQGNLLISEKIGLGMQGQKPWNKGTENPYSKETLARMSAGQIERFSKSPGTNKGRILSFEQRKKISDTMKERGIQPSTKTRRLGVMARQAA
jgi:hypothetical protein